MDKTVINLDEARQRMALRQPLMTCLDLERLPERLNDQMMAALREIVDAPLPAQAECDEVHFAQCLRFMTAVLPKQAKDEIDGKLFVTAYRRMLGSYSREEISFLAEYAMANCRWFPTIAECLEIIERYVRDDDETRFRIAVHQRLNQERSARHEDRMAIMREKRAKEEQATPKFRMTQDDVDRLPAYLVKLGLQVGALVEDRNGKVVPFQDMEEENDLR